MRRLRAVWLWHSGAPGCPGNRSRRGRRGVFCDGREICWRSCALSFLLLSLRPGVFGVVFWGAQAILIRCFLLLVILLLRQFFAFCLANDFDWGSALLFFVTLVFFVLRW